MSLWGAAPKAFLQGLHAQARADVRATVARFKSRQRTKGYL
jgi:hypothetical protein